MALTLFLNPFASFCQKVLDTPYENDTPFDAHLVDLGDPTSRAAFLNVWPIGKFPVLRDESAYLNRLMARPSFARVVKEAEPYFRLFPR